MGGPDRRGRGERAEVEDEARDSGGQFWIRQKEI